MFVLLARVRAAGVSLCCCALLLLILFALLLRWELVLKRGALEKCPGSPLRVGEVLLVLRNARRRVGAARWFVGEV